MFYFKPPKFKSKKDAYGKFLSYFFAPFALPCISLGLVFRAQSYYGDISYDNTKNYIFFVVVVSLIVIIYCWYKAFWALTAYMNDNFGNTPEAVICLNCLSPFLFENVNGFSCPKCSGELEDLEGFYERHPELRECERKVEYNL